LKEAVKGNEGVSLDFILDAGSERGSIEKLGEKDREKSEKWKREKVEEKVRDGRVIPYG
jgi:hypothetical protein